MANDEALLRDLTDDDPETRLHAVLKAAEPTDEPAAGPLVEGLVRRLHDPHPGVIQASLESLTRLIEAGRASVGDQALDRAIELAEHDSPLVRAEAVGALGVFCPDAERPRRSTRLLAALEDKDDEVRRTAAAACGDLGLDAARPLLAERLLAHPATRFEAAFALASLKDPRARAVLENALGAKKTRLDALEGLRRLGDPNAAPAVRTVANGWLVPWVDRLSAWATLATFGDPNAGQRLRDKTESRRMEERVYALYLLGRYRISAGREAVTRIAQNPSHRERETALDALAHYGDADATTLLIAVAEDPNESSDARVTAARSLALLAGPEVEQARERLRRHPDPALRATATPNPRQF